MRPLFGPFRARSAIVPFEPAQRSAIVVSSRVDRGMPMLLVDAVHVIETVRGVLMWMSAIALSLCQFE